MDPDWQIKMTAGWKQCKWKLPWRWLTSNPVGFGNTKGCWKSIRWRKSDWKWLSILLLTEQEFTESEKHKNYVPTHDFVVVNYEVLFVELAALALISDKGHFSRLYCMSNMKPYNSVWDFCHIYAGFLQTFLSKLHKLSTNFWDHLFLDPKTRFDSLLTYSHLMYHMWQVCTLFTSEFKWESIAISWS